MESLRLKARQAMYHQATYAGTSATTARFVKALIAVNLVVSVIQLGLFLNDRISFLESVSAQVAMTVSGALFGVALLSIAYLSWRLVEKATENRSWRRQKIAADASEFDVHVLLIQSLVATAFAAMGLSYVL